MVKNIIFMFFSMEYKIYSLQYYHHIAKYNIAYIKPSLF